MLIYEIKSLRGSFKKEHCIFYDIWQNGRGSTDNNQISEKNQNMDKFLEGVGEKICCYNLKSLMFCFKMFQTVLLCPIISQNFILPLDYDNYLAHFSFH